MQSSSSIGEGDANPVILGKPMRQTYLIALGSNMRVPGLGLPHNVIEAALHELDSSWVECIGASPIVASAPVGPSQRTYANAVAAIATELSPLALLARLQQLEYAFGRNKAQRRGSRWRARALDLDIILWSGGIWRSRTLAIPHRLMHHRGFVLGPAALLAPRWRDPISGLTIAQLNARLTRPRPLTN
ncbi:MAG: 2-amino-4-hydroxy-6-hydroxymethyldihydropteridine diphosphokinase [Pseudomonadota bacterium]